jgi:hypothetical protein
MRYTERPEFPYDPKIFGLRDTQTALSIYDEGVRKHGPRPPPVFYEVDRSADKLDPLWNVPMTGRDVVSRVLKVPCINVHPGNQWTMTQQGLVPAQKDNFLVSHKSLIQFDWFPNRGDLVVFKGYRYMIIDVNIPGEAYWQQTDVWLGLELRCIVPADGDGRPRIPTAHELYSLQVPSVATTEVQSPPDVPGSQTV